MEKTKNRKKACYNCTNCDRVKVKCFELDLEIEDMMGTTCPKFESIYGK